MQAQTKDINSLKDTYKLMKKLGKKERLDFLNSVVSYCDFLGFSHEKTMMMLALVRNVIPQTSQSFNNCDLFDEIDIQFNKYMEDRKIGDIKDELSTDE